LRKGAGRNLTQCVKLLLGYHLVTSLRPSEVFERCQDSLGTGRPKCELVMRLEMWPLAAREANGTLMLKVCLQV